MMSHLKTIIHRVVNFNQLKQFHAQLIQNSLHIQISWVAQLINLCTRLRAPPLYTLHIFNSAHQPDSLVFSNLIKYYSQWGDNTIIHQLFYQMQECNVKPDTSIYPILIKSSGRNGIVFHAHLMKMGLDCAKYIRNAIMRVYGKYGPIELSRQLFDEMPDRRIMDWNSMISSYWNWENEVEANKLFDLSPEKDVSTWTAMVSGYSKMKDLKNARKFFDKMPEKTIVSWNAMLSGYVQNKFSEEAISLFNDMMNSEIKPDERTWVSVISSCSSRGDPKLAESLIKMIKENNVLLNCFIKTALLDMHAKCGNLIMAKKMFDELGSYKNLISWNAMISCYAKFGDLCTAKELFDEMPEKDIFSWNTIIAGYAQNGQSAIAINLFHEMKNDTRIKPDEVTMVSVISACGNLGSLELANQVMSYITENKNKIKLSLSGYNSLVFMYSKCGSMKESENIFSKMKKRDLISYNTLITGFGAYGNGIKALELLKMMKEEGIEPDRVTYIGVLNACSHEGLSEEGIKVFKSIKNPDIDHYACIVDLLGRVGKLDEAKRVIDDMPMKPHSGVYGALLNASAVYKRVDLGEFAANKLFEIEPENSGYFVLLSNIYASLGMWKDVERVRGLMKKGGVRNTSGWSFV